jgi:hypothetical protein
MVEGRGRPGPGPGPGATTGRVVDTVSGSLSGLSARTGGGAVRTEVLRKTEYRGLLRRRPGRLPSLALIGIAF